MSGITGVLNLKEKAPVSQELVLQMLAAIQHRGPDGFGIYRDAWIGMGSARLSINDLLGGDQPVGNENGSLWIVFDGEIFNSVELRPDLEKRGHTFNTNGDTEVILHLYEDFGPGCLQYLNGQFAIAIWDQRRRSLFLARDRVGVRPLFYTKTSGQLIFGSEIKSMLAHPSIQPRIDHQSLREAFTYWSPLPPHTIFQGIYELPPAHYMLIEDGDVLPPERYWALDLTAEEPARPAEEYLEELEALLIDATRIRLRAGVPVGAYLSGGLDSSTTTALIRSYNPNRLDTFSISFSDQNFAESTTQAQVAKFLGTHHHEIFCSNQDIGSAFPEVVWHTETPILRTSPAPMFLLSKLVRQHNFKVVLTGEGADEFLAGYDIFKEMKIRRFWAKDHESVLRPRLLCRIYPDIAAFGGRLSAGGDFMTAFFKKDLALTGSPFYSHLIRWKNTARTWRFLNQTPATRLVNSPDGPCVEPAALELPEDFYSWNDLNRAQYLEIVTFLSPYLLSSQGDRMAMANSVEGRYPFLDVRVMEFCNHLPPQMKMPVLIEKWLLKQLGKKYIPANIWQRNKRPYRAPIHRSFFEPYPPDYVQDLLSETALRQSGCFEPSAVARLANKAASGTGLSEVEDMALVGILSTQLVDQMFVQGKIPASLSSIPECRKVIDRLAVGV